MSMRGCAVTNANISLRENISRYKGFTDTSHAKPICLTEPTSAFAIYQTCVPDLDYEGICDMLKMTMHYARIDSRFNLLSLSMHTRISLFFTFSAALAIHRLKFIIKLVPNTCIGWQKILRNSKSFKIVFASRYPHLDLTLLTTSFPRKLIKQSPGAFIRKLTSIKL